MTRGTPILENHHMALSEHLGKTPSSPLENKDSPHLALSCGGYTIAYFQTQLFVEPPGA